MQMLIVYKRDLEAQLTPAIHSNGQLLSEIEKEELMLEDDIERLEALEREVKAKEEKMQEKVKAIHPLLAFKDAPGKQIDAIELTDSEKLDTSLEVRKHALAYITSKVWPVLIFKFCPFRVILMTICLLSRGN